MDRLFDIHDINTLLFSLVPNELRGVNKYYYSMSKGLKFTYSGSDFDKIINVLKPSFKKIKEVDLALGTGEITSYCYYIYKTDLTYYDLELLNPEKLRIRYVTYRSNFNHMSNLIDLDISDCPFLSYSQIKSCTNLKRLNVYNSSLTVNVNTMENIFYSWLIFWLKHLEHLEEIIFGRQLYANFNAGDLEREALNTDISHIKTNYNIKKIVLVCGNRLLNTYNLYVMTKIDGVWNEDKHIVSMDIPLIDIINH